MHGLPTKCEYETELILEKISSDKKRRGNEITLVIPEKIGKCSLKTMALKDAIEFIKGGLE